LPLGGRKPVEKRQVSFRQAALFHKKLGGAAGHCGAKRAYRLGGAPVVGWSPNLGRIAAQTGLLGDETRQAVTGPAPAGTDTDD
jgi:hypothetical protein